MKPVVSKQPLPLTDGLSGYLRFSSDDFDRLLAEIESDPTFQGDREAMRQMLRGTPKDPGEVQEPREFP